MGQVGLSGFVFVMTQTQPDPLLKKTFIIQLNPPTPKNWLNPTGWVGLGRVGFSRLVGWLHTPCICMWHWKYDKHQSYHYSFWLAMLQCWPYFDKPQCWSPYLLSNLNELFLLPKKSVSYPSFFPHTHATLIYIYIIIVYW